MLIFFDRRCVEYSQPDHVERPARITNSVPYLRKEHPDWIWQQPEPATEQMLLRAHSPQHLARIRAAAADFDSDTPAYSDIFDHAVRATGAAVGVTREAQAGHRSFSLMRPPGHHAISDRAMGFCYFNCIAVAALDALINGAERVAIWDFDAHHGNGTEAIVAHNSQITFASIHQFPCYPGTGKESFANIINLPVPPLAPRHQHMGEIERGLNSLITFKPDLILVSAGFDAYAGDPITQMTLEPEDFTTMGRWLAECGVAAGAILEGGYSNELPSLIDAFLVGWTSS